MYKATLGSLAVALILAGCSGGNSGTGPSKTSANNPIPIRLLREITA